MKRRSNNACALLAALGPLGLAAAQPPVTAAQAPAGASAPPAPVPPASALEEAIRTLADGSAPIGARETAAAMLVRSDRAEAVEALEQALRAPEPAAASTRALVLTAIARCPAPDGRLFQVVADLAGPGPEDAAPAAIEALGSFRNRDAVDLLLSHCDPRHPPPHRTASFRALERLTGQEFGEDRERWTAWYRPLAAAAEGEWQAAIAAGQAARADRLGAERRDAFTRLSDAMRRLYLALNAAPTEQARVLASLLADERNELRSLGFDILSRELSAGRTVDSAVVDALIPLLRHPIPLSRARAATALRQLSVERAAPVLEEALRTETSPDAAAAMLLAASRWPSEALRAAALRWLPAGPEPRAAAVQALLALSRTGLLAAESDRRTVAEALGGADVSTLTAPECRLLVFAGTTEDRDRIATLLRSGSVATRRMAADALAERPEFLDRLLGAADPELFEFAARAAAAHAPTSASFRSLWSLPAATPEARRAGLLRVAAAMPVPELLAAARIADDAVMRDAMLSRLAEAPAPAEAEPGSLCAGLLMLAEARMELEKPDEAIDALDAIPSDAHATDAARMAAVRTAALVWIGRLQDADGLGAPASAWLDGLERALAEPHAKDAAAAIGRKFAGALSPYDDARLRALTQKINGR